MSSDSSVKVEEVESPHDFWGTPSQAELVLDVQNWSRATPIVALMAEQDREEELPGAPKVHSLSGHPLGIED